MNSGRLARHIRLLPAVLVAGSGLLALKGIGIVHNASAQEKPPRIAAEHATVTARDFASDDHESSSAAEADVLTSLSKRRAELDSRAREQAMRGNILAATEKRIDAKIAALKALQTRITELLGQRDAAQEAQVKSLVKTYSAMKPKDAARIFDGLNEDVLVPVAQQMKSDALAPVLAAMNPQAAQKLTLRLASRLKLPDSADSTPLAQPAAGAPPAAPVTLAAGTAPAAAQPQPSADTAPKTPPSAQPPQPSTAPPQPQADPAAKHG
jgi:flagellar motility protein MotE (MotC chaperone)